jgi:hypothetical protein
MARNSRKKARAAQRACVGKQPMTIDQARAVAGRLHRRDGATMSFYQCGSCDAWHVGHTPRSVLQSVRDRRRWAS